MKKKIMILTAAFTLALGLGACGAGNAESTAQTEAETAAPDADQDTETAGENTDSQGTDGSRILIAYFTAAENSGVDAVASASYSDVNGEAKGRMQALAEMIQDVTGGDLFPIRTEETYPADGGDLIDYASQEQSEDARPALTTHIENPDDYDIIFVGYPIWWGIAAWPVDSFVETNDFTGKTVIPFCTSASSGLGDSGALLAEMAGTGDWQEGMRFRSGADEADVQEWVSGLGL